LRRVPPRRWSWDYRHESQKREGEPEGAPRDQRRYAIWIDGEHVGFASRAFGFGKQGYSIERLGPEIAYTLNLGEHVVWPVSIREGRLLDPDQVARKALELRLEKRWGADALKKLFTEAELEPWLKVQRKRKEREEREEAERAARWKREREEAARAAEELRSDIESGLRSIDERLGSQLSNMEANALRYAIERYSAERKE
jgi:hypothetical protein